MNVADATQRLGDRKRAAAAQVEGKNTEPEYQDKNICRLHIAGKIPSDKKQPDLSGRAVL